jgi:hypothetical protein
VKDIIFQFLCSYWIVSAGVWSIIYGYFCFEIHGIQEDHVKKQGESWKRNQHWFNGLGAFIGVFCLWLLFEKSPAELGAVHLVLGVIAYAGITGYLPYILTLGKFK